ncbi:hypothetical protein PMAA_096990 [Talaromyces marneffei ATCC 18224]|uniref:Aminoglycoside phosphotransferase domain-containing protein n=1 Tax=Talaromyces marneffei (strain ATCC 18224 / CBS 334.59 / QM 7333) TaxID=441960 RepID=B6QIB1_TALMQ|nr:hypothetical protein PMAA_096990 [Talaromyces marneffei ATCC 18224]
MLATYIHNAPQRDLLLASISLLYSRLKFFLKHVDDKGDHLLVDDEYNITGIIDWQFARIVPAAEAFGPSYVAPDLESLYSSSSGISADVRLLTGSLRSRGYHDLATFAGGNEVMRRFHHGLADGLS